MRYVLAPLAVLSATALLFTSITPAHACSCLVAPLEDRVQFADIVVVGEVASLTTETIVVGQSPPFDTISGAIVEVKRYLKGSGSSPISVDESASALTTCNWFGRDSVNQRHLLFLFAQDGRLLTHLCSGNVILTGDADAANAALAEVEAILTGQPAVLPPTGGATVGAVGSDLVLVLLALGVALQVVGAFAITRRGARR